MPASDHLLRELLLRGHVRSPKATVGKGGKRCRARPWAETLVKGYVTPPERGHPVQMRDGARPPKCHRPGEAASPPRCRRGRLPRRRLSAAGKEAELSLQMHFRSLPWRRRSANTTKNMQKINSPVRSGPATSFSLRHLALLWEALIIFYCFTHSQKYDETRTECVFFLSYYSKHHKLFTHETQPHFLLKRSFLLSSGAWTSQPPWAGSSTGVAQEVTSTSSCPRSPPREPQGFPTHHSLNA